MNLTITRENEDEQADQFECTWASICSNGRYDRPSFEGFKARLVKRLRFNMDGGEALLWCKPNYGRKNEIIDDDDLVVAMNFALHRGLESLSFTVQNQAAAHDVATLATRTNLAKPVQSPDTRNLAIVDRLTGGGGIAYSHEDAMTSPKHDASPTADPVQTATSIPNRAVHDEPTESTRPTNCIVADEFASLTRLTRGVNNVIRALQGRDLLHDWDDC
ncbi:MAG: hypothetical protein Q9180_001335 [Flavoplaca navasiana]